jgi:methyltransferase family protein
MRWKVKAAIQKTLALLPQRIGNRAYYLLQKRAGGLRHFNPLRPMSNGVKTAARIEGAGRSPVGGVFFEVGTGWDLFLPISYWLMGAERVITVDVNRHVQTDVIASGLRYLLAHRGQVEALFGTRLVRPRLDALLGRRGCTVLGRGGVIELCNITYMAPADAGSTQLPDQSIDFHTSCTVLEHVTPDDLCSILIEGRRIVKDDGLFVHAIDYTDHFSHSDSSISAINFLRYSDAQWRRYGNTRFMYSNRLRHDDFLELFGSLGYQLLAEEPDVKPEIVNYIENGFPVHPSFRGKRLAVTGNAAKATLMRAPVRNVFSQWAQEPEYRGRYGASDSRQDRRSL